MSNLTHNIRQLLRDKRRRKILGDDEVVLDPTKLSKEDRARIAKKEKAIRNSVFRRYDWIAS